MQQHAAEAITGSDGDVVLLSPTGTGKTLAYLLPLVQLIERDATNLSPLTSIPSPLCLVITPGRELALQTHNVLYSMGCGLRSTACYGGRPAMDEHKVLKEVRPQIVFGTPGRLNDHLDKGNISRYNIRYLVIDEFDKCLEMGFHAEMAKLIKSLPALQQRILLSATNAEQIPQFVNMAKKGTVIDFLPDDEQTSRVTLYEVHSPQKDKLETLRQLLLSVGDESSIVFLNYRDSVERVNDFLRKQGFTTSYFHGGLEQNSARICSTGSATVRPTSLSLPTSPHAALTFPTFKTSSTTICPRARRPTSTAWAAPPAGTPPAAHSSSSMPLSTSPSLSLTIHH